MNTCVIYTRVSRERAEEKEVSIGSQLEQCTRKADELCADVLKVFSDRNRSARTNNRPDFQKALEYCEHNKVDYFIVWDSSRFSRNILNANSDRSRLERCGTQVKYVTAEIDDTDSGFLLRSMLDILDEHQSRKIGTDTRRSMVLNAQEGYFNGGRVPYGFKVVADAVNAKKKRLALHEDEADVVRQVFDLRSQGIGAKAIADQLNESYIKHRGNNWTKVRVTQLLRNEKVAGITVFGKMNHQKVAQPEDTWIRVNSHPPIIEESQFREVQRMMNAAITTQDTSSPHSTRAFTGLLRCAKCDLNYKVISGKGRSKRYYYYSCPNCKSGLNCQNRRFRTDLFDEWMVNYLAEQILPPHQLQRIVDAFNDTADTWDDRRSEKLGRLRSQLKVVDQSLDRLYSAIETDDDVDLKMIGPRLKDNVNRKEELEDEISRVLSAPAPEKVTLTAEDLSQYCQEKLMKDNDGKKRREFISTFVKKVVINENSAVIHYLPDSLLTHDLSGVPSKVDWLPDLGSNQGQTD